MILPMPSVRNHSGTMGSTTLGVPIWWLGLPAQKPLDPIGGAIYRWIAATWQIAFRLPASFGPVDVGLLIGPP